MRINETILLKGRLGFARLTSSFSTSTLLLAVNSEASSNFINNHQEIGLTSISNASQIKPGGGKIKFLVIW